MRQMIRYEFRLLRCFVFFFSGFQIRSWRRSPGTAAIMGYWMGRSCRKCNMIRCWSLLTVDDFFALEVFVKGQLNWPCFSVDWWTVDRFRCEIPCVLQDRVPSAEALVAFEFASREEGIRVAELWVETRNHEYQSLSTTWKNHLEIVVLPCFTYNSWKLCTWHCQSQTAHCKIFRPLPMATPRGAMRHYQCQFWQIIDRHGMTTNDMGPG